MPDPSRCGLRGRYHRSEHSCRIKKQELSYARKMAKHKAKAAPQAKKSTQGLNSNFSFKSEKVNNKEIEYSEFGYRKKASLSNVRKYSGDTEDHLVGTFVDDQGHQRYVALSQDGNAYGLEYSLAGTLAHVAREDCAKNQNKNYVIGGGYYPSPNFFPRLSRVKIETIPMSDTKQYKLESYNGDANAVMEIRMRSFISEREGAEEIWEVGVVYKGELNGEQREAHRLRTVVLPKRGQYLEPYIQEIAESMQKSEFNRKREGENTYFNSNGEMIVESKLKTEKKLGNNNKNLSLDHETGQLSLNGESLKTNTSYDRVFAEEGIQGIKNRIFDKDCFELNCYLEI